MSNSLNTYDLIKRGLNAAAVRSETIANNIANVNTSGYKAFKVVFEEKYKDSGFNMKATNEKHIQRKNQEV